MKKLGNRVRGILEVDGESFTVHLRFSDGAIGSVSLAHLFKPARGLAADILRGGMFAMCFVENGALAWPNGFELCPDTLRAGLVSAVRRKRRVGRVARSRPAVRPAFSKRTARKPAPR